MLSGAKRNKVRIMNKYILILLLNSSVLPLFSQTLFTIGNEKVPSSEFTRAYNKNKIVVDDREKSMREYLDLYINFKLKVKAARELKLDTLSQLRDDLTNFRQQIQENYVVDESISKKLFNEAFERSHKDLHVLYFSVSDANDSAEKSAMVLYNKLQSAKADPTAVLESVKNSGVNVKSSDIGFITVFSVSYVLENIIYDLKLGEISKPYHYKDAWYIFKLLEEREAAGKWKVAQIMLSMPPNADASVSAAIKSKADSVYHLVKNRGDFADLAKTFSDDKLTFGSGGELAEFGTGKYDIAFEKEVFKISNDGDITMPFLTSQGYHIVKRLSRTAIPNNIEDPLITYDLKQKLQEDSRLNISRDKLAANMMGPTAIKRAAGITDVELMKYADSVNKNPSIEEAGMPFAKKIVLTFKKGTQTGADWVRFIRYSNLGAGATIKELWPKFMTWATLEYYRQHLEEYNEDFHFQMQEFREGNMLFEAMERNVWGKAAMDTVGLEQYYKDNSENYKWAESGDMLIINILKNETADFVKKALLDEKSRSDIVEDMQDVQIDSGRYEIAQVAALTKGNIVDKDGYSPYYKNSDSSITFIKLLRTYPANQHRNFEDARGLIIDDYQNVLEKKWIKDLRKKYPHKINESEFQLILKEK